MARRVLSRGSVAAALLLAACGGDEEKKGSGQPLGCEPACEAGQVCIDRACLPDGDGDGVPDDLDRCPGTPAGLQVDDEGCAWDEAPVPFSEGPWGTGIRDTAGDFTVQTLGGTFQLRERWTGYHSFVFFLRSANSPYSLGVWGSDVGRLLAESPPSVHYLFLDAGADEAARRGELEALRDRFEEKLGALQAEEAAAWRERLHFVTDDVRSLDGALGSFFDVSPAFAFAIDRFQRWREVGLLYDWRNGSTPIHPLAREAAWFDYERALERKLGRLDAEAAVVPVFEGDRHPGGWAEGYGTSVQVEFPAAASLERFDSMGVYLYTACPGHLQGVDAGCNEWDYAAHLWLCDVDDPTRCDTELVRYVTPYGREGEWFTDVSELLPLLAAGGTRTLRYEGANGYDMHLRFYFWDAGKSHKPVELRFLWGGRDAFPWNLETNGAFAPVTFTVADPGATSFGIYSVVTGHGHSSTLENCAEFCDSEHRFSLNGNDFTESHPVTRDTLGCYKQVEAGVVPNQFGSWPFGRAGWCAGQDVKPWVADVSEALVSGENTLTYRALFRGQDYQPAVTDPAGYLPEFRLQSWLVRYEARP